MQNQSELSPPQISLLRFTNSQCYPLHHQPCLHPIPITEMLITMLILTSAHNLMSSMYPENLTHPHNCNPLYPPCKKGLMTFPWMSGPNRTKNSQLINKVTPKKKGSIDTVLSLLHHDPLFTYIMVFLLFLSQLCISVILGYYQKHASIYLIVFLTIKFS